MDFSSVCRTCLSSNYLNPIFKINNDPDMYSTVIYRATGVQVRSNDNLPQNMCSNCINMLNNILKFRKLCRDTEIKLLSIISEEKNVVNKELKKTNNKLETDTILKIEIKDDYSENDTDFDDDKPLQTLLDSESTTSRIKIEQNAKDEETSTDSDSVVETFNVNIPNNILKEELTNKHNKTNNVSHNNISVNEITSENPTPSITKTIKKSPKNTQFSSIHDPTIVNTTEIPYELITDPVTTKVTRVLCKLCNKELSIRSIDCHMTRRHPGADGRKVKCDLCDTYVLKEKLNRHKIMIHGSKGFRCGYCKSEYETKQQLLDHVDTCTGKKRKRKVNESGRELSECDVCHQMMQKASLRMHKAVKHAGLRPVCEHCGKSFGNKFRLNEHYRAKHGYEKFQCSYCDFRSASAMAMKNHERRHRGEKPFVCEECGAKFHAAYLLAQHKHSHRTEKLIKCDICPASFKANNSLHMHKLTCHSSAMYRCVICCRSYKCRHYAVKHVRHVHRYTGTNPPLAVVNNEDVEKIT